MPSPNGLKKLLTLLPGIVLYLLVWLVFSSFIWLPIFQKVPDRYDMIILLLLAVMIVASSLFLGSQYKIILDESGVKDFRSWSEQWRRDLEKLLIRLETQTKESAITLSDYFKLLKDTNAQTIQFMGTMVGYSYAMFKPLSHYVITTEGDLNVDIIGTTFKLGHDHDYLITYPVSLIVKTIKELMDSPRARQVGKKTLTFQVNYLDKDILHAFMAIGEHKIMIVQALAPKNANFIFESQYEGKIITSESQYSSDARIDRYLAAFKNIKMESKEKPNEIWKLTMKESGFTLNVSGFSFWQYVQDKNEPDLEFNLDGEMMSTNIEVDDHGLKRFVTSFYERLVRLNPRIREKDDEVSEHWKRYIESEAGE